MTRQINTGSNPAYLTLVENYPTLAAFPSADPNTLGDLAYAQDTGLTYVSEGGAWVLVGGGGGGGQFTPTLVTLDYNASYLDLVEADQNGGDITVTLPAASAAGSGGNFLAVKAVATAGGHVVSVTPGAGDTIDGGGAVSLATDETLYLVSDGVSDWVSLVLSKVTFDLASNTFTFNGPAASTNIKIAGHVVIVVDTASSSVQDPSGSAFVLFTNAIARIAYGNNILQCDGAGIRIFNAVFVTANYTTGGRPNAVTAGSGAQIYDTDLSKPIWSDGAVWRDAAGNAV